MQSDQILPINPYIRSEIFKGSTAHPVRVSGTIRRKMASILTLHSRVNMRHFFYHK